MRVYRSVDNGSTWEVAYEFPPGEIRHIHTVQWDPIGKALWIGTGDTDSESRIGYSKDHGETFVWVGRESQLYRTVSFQFLDDSVLWVVDSNEKASMRVVAWKRAQNSIEISDYSLPAPAYYGQSLTGDSGIVTLGHSELSVWSVNNSLESRKLFEWPVTRRSRSPNPAVRLPRGPIEESNTIYLNPLRADDTSAAIFRVPVEQLLH